MLFIQICVGSSCHLKGAPDIVELLQNKIAECHLENNIVLSGSFCTGKCNRVGVTVTVGEDVHAGITKDNFSDFWQNVVLPALENAKENQ